MYTRCPSCRAEISFEPPVNAASLPDGYKHKIKCPSCGVTIGVKIPRLDSAVQPTFTPQNPNAVSSEPVFNATPAETAEAPAKAKAKKAPYGRAANIFVLLFSAALAVVLGFAYLVNTGSLKVDFLSGLAAFDPITPLLLIIEGAADMEIIAIILALLPTITLALAVINAIVAIICCAVGTYSRVYNLIWGLLLLAGGVACLFQSTFMFMAYPELLAELAGGYTPSTLELFMLPVFEIIESGLYVAFAVPGLGILSFLTSLFSLGVRRKKAKAE